MTTRTRFNVNALFCILIIAVLFTICCTNQNDDGVRLGSDDDTSTLDDDVGPDDATDDDAWDDTTVDDSEDADDTADDTVDDDLADDDLDDDADDDTAPMGCPPNFVLIPAGDYTIVLEGYRTGEPQGWQEPKVVHLDAYCLAVYEASQPDATATDRGSFFHQHLIPPPAQVKPGVYPWGGATWHEATSACQEQGWRLPTYEELQVAMTRGRPENIWMYGVTDPEGDQVPDGEWDCHLAEQSWMETCAGPRERQWDDQGHPIDEYGVTGGTGGQSDYGSGVYDLLGNVAEWTASPWDVNCYGMTRPEIFASSFHGRAEGWRNAENPDPENPGCWRMSDYAGHARGRHEHRYFIDGPGDDGFRCAADPGDWSGWQNRTEANPYYEPGNAWFYDWATSQKRHYSVPKDPNQGEPIVLD